MLAKLNHRNLPRVYDFFEAGGKQYLVMDFVNGETLEQVLKRSPKGLPINDVMKVADQLCDVLDYLHNQKKPVIFRDLKPGNIMINDAGEVKLIDFGIARHFAAGKSSDTIALGTMGYAPAEQYGKGQTDARSDIYALGATLHALLTGIDPADNPFTFVSPRSVRPAVPVEIDLAIMRAVEQNPASRWQNARVMKQALHGVKDKPKPPPAPVFAPPKPVAVSAATSASRSVPRAPAAPASAAKSNAQAPAKPAAAHDGALSFWPALSLGVLIGAAVVFGLEVWGWVPQPDNFLQTSVSLSIFWFTGVLAYVIAKRPVAACAAWTVEPLLRYSDAGSVRLLIPLAVGVVFGALMSIGRSRVTYGKLLTAALLTMAAEQAALIYFLNADFRVEQVVGALIGASVAYVVGWAFRR
jgi:hypothetical protein